MLDLLSRRLAPWTLALVVQALLGSACGSDGAPAATPAPHVPGPDGMAEDPDAGPAVTLDINEPTDAPPCPPFEEAIAPAAPVQEDGGPMGAYLMERVANAEALLPLDALPAARQALIRGLGFDRIEPPGTAVASELLDVVPMADDVVAERRLLEVHPGLWIPTLVLRPKEPGPPAPGILVQHGHNEPGKTKAAILTLSATLARRGCIVVVPDWLGFGDMKGKANGHIMVLGNALAGVPFNVPVTSVPRRALDYLAGRADVDPSRIGAAGHSGGAETVMYLAAVDERIAAVAIVDGVDDWAWRLEQKLFKDPEHFVESWLTVGGYRLTLALASPRWVGVITGDDDTTAGPTGVVALVVEDARAAFTADGAPDRLRHTGVPGGHNLQAPKRQAVYALFADAFGVPALAGPEEGPAFEDDPKLRVPQPEGNRTTLDIVRQHMDDALSDSTGPVRDELLAVLGSPAASSPVLELTDGADGVLQGFVQRGEGPDLPVRLRRATAPVRAVVACFSDYGNGGCEPLARMLAGTGISVASVDLRGLGTLDAGFSIDLPNERVRLGNLLIALGDPLPSMWCRDVADVGLALASTEGTEQIGVVGIGPRAGFAALLVGAAFEDLSPVVALDAYLTLRSAWDVTPALAAPVDLYPYGLFTVTGGKGLIQLLDGRPSIVDDVWGGTGPEVTDTCELLRHLP